VCLALVCGGAAAVGVNQLVNNAPNRRGAGVQVVVAAVDIPRGGTITAELLKTREFPKDLVPPGAIDKMEDAIDRAVFIPLLKDDPVLNGKLSPKGSGRGLAALVPVGMRAFTIHTPSVASGVAGFVMPGHKVDVLLTMTDSGGNDQSGGGSTTTLLQNVEILAVDQKIDAPAENKMEKDLRSVTLLVTPQQANELALGQNKGILHLELRNKDDKDDSRTRPATVTDLRFHQEKPWDERAKDVFAALGKALAQRKPPPAAATPAPKAPEQPPERRIRTMRGSREGEVVIQLPETRSAVTDLGP